MESNYFSDTQFASMSLCPKLLEVLSDLGFKVATEIQKESIPKAMAGEDIIGSAKTGSGKSLAFLVPSVDYILRHDKECGINVLVITPVRELAMQLYDLTKQLLRDNGTICALSIGGKNYSKEKEKLSSENVRILIATPGRLNDHMINTKNFDYSKVKMLILDEADKILKIGFEKEVTEIIKRLPIERQTMLFSATITPKVEDLIRLSMKKYSHINIQKDSDPSVETLLQGFVQMDADKKFIFLYTFLKRNKNDKILVFFSTCKQVEYFSALLNYVDIPVLSITGEDKQQKRTTTFQTFTAMEKGTLLCTDVAQRGLDFPDITYVIQYDPPHDAEEYLHRVGRTARGANKTGKALLMLLPNESNFIRILKLYKINLVEYEFPQKVAQIQEKLEILVNKKGSSLQKPAIEAYRAYIHSYNAQVDKDTYDLEKLDLLKVSKSFGLSAPPFVHLNVRVKSSGNKRRERNRNFSNSNRNNSNNIGGGNSKGNNNMQYIR